MEKDRVGSQKEWRLKRLATHVHSYVNNLLYITLPIYIQR